MFAQRTTRLERAGRSLTLSLILIFLLFPTVSANNPSGYVPYWVSFADNTSGDRLFDEVNNNLSFSPNATWTPGIHNNAIHLGLDLPDNTFRLGFGLGSMVGTKHTAQAWVYINSTERWMIMAMNDVGSPPFAIEYESTLFKCRYNFLGKNVQSLASPALNKWHHVACVYDGVNATLYVDGVKQGDVVFDFSTKNTERIQIGKYGVDNNTIFIGAGRVDEPSIFNESFSPLDVLYYNDSARTGTKDEYGLEPGDPQTAKVTTFINTTLYNITINITANNTNLSKMYINTSGLGASHNNNLSINLSEHIVSRSGNLTNYSFSTFIGDLGFGNFTINVFNETLSLKGVGAAVTINITVPVILRIEDQVTGTGVPNTNFTYSNRNTTNTTGWGDPITSTTLTNASGETEIGIFWFGDLTNISFSTAGIPGFIDGSLIVTPLKKGNQRIIFQLESVGGAGQVIIQWKDSLNYQPLQGISINTTEHGSGITDTWGKISFVGVIGETLTGIATRSGYISKPISIEIFNRNEIIYMFKTGNIFNESVNVFIEPEGLYIDNSTIQYLFINIENWQSLKNMTVAVSINNEIMNLYAEFGANFTNLGSELQILNFTINDTDVWCNASTLCTGNGNKIRFRPFPAPLRDFGPHVIVYLKYYDTQESPDEYKKGGIYLAPNDRITTFLDNFSEEQQSFFGLFLLLAGTVGLAVRLKLTKFSGGVVAFMIIVANMAIGLWSIDIGAIPLIISSLLMFKGATE